MIAYDLQCENSHCFEGWFEDSRAYANQKKKGLISCPVCDTTAIHRIPSTFAIKSSSSGSGSMPLDSKIDEFSKKIVDYVEKNFDNVGTDFTREALKMHYGVSEPRNIRGVSTQQEETLLKDEGVEFIKIPMPVSSDPEKEPDA